MTKTINPSMIEWISKNWNDRYHAGEVQEIVEAIVAELKQDCREAQRRFRRDDAAMLESLIEDVKTEMFWNKMEILRDYRFDY